MSRDDGTLSAASCSGAPRTPTTQFRELVELSADGAVLPLFQSSHLSGPPSDGTEAFSLIPRSALAPDDSLSAFFDTGSELQQQS